MDPIVIQALIGLVALIAGGLIAGMFNRSDNRFDSRLEAQQKLYDQLQEDLNAERRQREKDVDRIHALLDMSHRKDNYIGELRQHINDQKPPPPPDWPEGLGD